MMDGSEFSTMKTILASMSAPFTFILGAIGWHYKNVYSKVEELDDTTNKLLVTVSEHSIQVSHLNTSLEKLDDKLECLFKKLDLI